MITADGLTFVDHEQSELNSEPKMVIVAPEDRFTYELARRAWERARSQNQELDLRNRGPGSPGRASHLATCQCTRSSNVSTASVLFKLAESSNEHDLSLRGVSVRMICDQLGDGELCVALLDAVGMLLDRHGAAANARMMVESARLMKQFRMELRETGGAAILRELTHSSDKTNKTCFVDLAGLERTAQFVYDHVNPVNLHDRYDELRVMVLQKSVELLSVNSEGCNNLCKIDHSDIFASIEGPCVGSNGGPKIHRTSAFAF